MADDETTETDEEFERFQNLTAELLKVPKKELDERRSDLPPGKRFA